MFFMCPKNTFLVIIKIATARNRAWVHRATICGTNHYTTVATLLDSASFPIYFTC